MTEQDWSLDPLESIHQSSCADQVSSYHLDSSVDQPELDRQQTSNAVDHSDAVCHSGSMDRTYRADESGMIPTPLTPTIADHPVVPVLSPPVSVVRICSVFSLVVAGVAVVLFILRRSRQSKA